ncbi:MAG: chromosomal replication initiator protein DnaA [Gemmataceae bacterium]
MTTSTQDATTALERAISRRVGEPRYRLWFDKHTRLRRDAETLVVGVPNRHFQEWLERTFQADVVAAAAEVYGEALAVRFAIEPDLFQAARREQQAVKSAPAVAVKAVKAEEQAKPEPARRTRRWAKLTEFVVGPCNRVAHAAALSVVEAPGECANPLVFHGPVGTGKTHLLEGIYAALRRAHPDWRVMYLTSEDFTNRFLAAMRQDRLGGFRKQFRDLDVLLIDDLHFLATKKATQVEFLHTFDALVADGRQLVLTTDCHPRLTEDFTPELIDRLLGGAMWGLTPPDAETRLELLIAKSRVAEGSPIPIEPLKFIASQLRGNVRELEGALQSVRHFSRVTGRPIDVALVREALAELLRHAVRVVKLPDVDAALCGVLRLEPGELQSKSRSWAVSHPRMVAMFLARKHTASSYSDIGGHFGGRNHSTVVAAEKKVRAWLEKDEELSLGPRRVRVRELVERVERDMLR